MKTTTVAEMKIKLDSILKQSERHPVLVTRDGEPIAVVMGLKNDQEFKAKLLAQSPRLADVLAASAKSLDAGLGIPQGEFWSRFFPVKKTLPKKRKVTRRRSV
jgi:prevent-host-death family protein